MFFSTLVVVASFLPVFLLTGQESKLFAPLAWTKTLILLIDAFLAVTLTPVLMSFLLKRKTKRIKKNPLNRGLERAYLPLLNFCLRHRWLTLGVNILAFLVAIPMFLSLGTEFMPPLDEGSILFMPVTLPDISNTELQRILQLQDKIIRETPEVTNVLGKAGRANTATDNSPLSMIETIILLKPRDQWRKGSDKDAIIEELNNKLQIPGVVNGWTQPIVNRINMLSTGVRTDVGIKVYGQQLDSIYSFAQKIKGALQGVDGVRDLYVEPITGGKYMDVVVKKDAVGRYGLSVDDVNGVVESALGGANVGTIIEGRRRFPLSVRLAQDFRSSIEQINRLPIQTVNFGAVPISEVADIRLTEGPPMITSENALLRGTVLFNVRGRDLGGAVEEAQRRLSDLSKTTPKGYFVEWSGQYENQIRANKTLLLIMPVVLILIGALLYFTYRSLKETVLAMITLPIALTGGVFMVFFYHVHLSVAVAVGFIALFGVAVETSMLMTIYLNDAMRALVRVKGNSRAAISDKDLRDAVVHSAVQRLRPKIMTVSVSLFGLIPILWATGVGSDVMKPIALPLIGGVLSSAVYVLLVTPVVFEMARLRELRKKGRIEIYGTE